MARIVLELTENARNICELGLLTFVRVVTYLSPNEVKKAFGSSSFQVQRYKRTGLSPDVFEPLCHDFEASCSHSPLPTRLQMVSNSAPQ